MLHPAKSKIATKQKSDLLYKATRLNNGMIYNEILEKTGASSATISRVNRSLLNGAGGYESILEKMKESGEE